VLSDYNVEEDEKPIDCGVIVIEHPALPSTISD
jgi:hypothetical protein